jgi:hypothetical protein
VDGIYTVTWKAVSSIDGHQTTGTFPFAVGAVNANAVQAIQQSASFRLPIGTLVAKFLMLASLAILIGQRLFIALCESRAGSSQNETINPFYGKHCIASAIGSSRPSDSASCHRLQQRE